MSNGALVLILLAFLALVLLMAFQASQIYAEGGLKPFFWPRLDHGYEVGLVTRLAAAPWLLLLFVLVLNGLLILLFDHDLFGRPNGEYKFWLAGALLPVLIIHLVDYQRSVLAAALAFLLVLAMAGLVAYVFAGSLVVLLTTPLLLWSLNGVRATYVDRIMG